VISLNRKAEEESTEDVRALKKLIDTRISAPFTALEKKAEEEEALDSKRREKFVSSIAIAAEEPRYKVKGMRLIFNHRNISSRDIIEEEGGRREH
jgi:hypothetical protein